jgi:Delta14-sterol reductase
VSYSYSIFVIALWLFGYVFARMANLQKDVFKRNPEDLFLGQQQKYIKTENGRLILTNIFWGISRHPNYFGELINSLCFGLVCGFDLGVVPYLYSAFIWTLLFTRFERDERKCLQKYGSDWQKYMKTVPNKIIPYIW